MKISMSGVKQGITVINTKLFGSYQWDIEKAYGWCSLCGFLHPQIVALDEMIYIIPIDATTILPHFVFFRSNSVR